MTPDIDNLCDWAEGLVYAFYNSGNVEALESCLEEVCFELGVDLPLGGLPKMKGHLKEQKETIEFLTQEHHYGN